MNDDLADRVRELMAHESGFAEKRMFGGVAMMLDGNMAVVVSGRGHGLMIRVAPADSAAFQAEPGVQATVMRGRPMRGWLDVDSSVVEDDAALTTWVGRGVTFTRTLPAK